MNAYRLRSVRPDLAPVTPAVLRRRRRVAAVLALSSLIVAVGLLDDPSLYDPQPGPNAPAYVNWRTGEVVQP